jgi:hypothetical protein
VGYAVGPVAELADARDLKSDVSKNYLDIVTILVYKV